MDCPSYNKWTLYDIVDKETKDFNLVPIFPCKSSYDFDRKNKYDEILNNWKMIFQVSNTKGRYFLELLDVELNPIELSYFKGGLWLKFFGHSNSLLSRSLMVDFIFYFLFLLYFIFYFPFSFIFLFLEQLRLGFISHTVTSVTSWWHSHKTDHRTWENGVEGSRIKWYHTIWTTHVGLMSYT